MAVQLPSATRRLLQDYRDITLHPVSTAVTAAPTPANIYEWHGNLSLFLASTNSTFTIHFTLLFPSSYPAAPPSLLLATRLPHENVLTAVGGYKVCLDMLDEGLEMEYKGWSRAYTVRSILMQLEAFLTDESELVNARLGTLEQARQDAVRYVCKKCGSRTAKPWPAFPTAEAVNRRVVREVKRPRIVKRDGNLGKKEEQKGKRKVGDDGWSEVSSKREQAEMKRRKGKSKEDAPPAKEEKKKLVDFSKAAGRVMVIKPGHQIRQAPKLLELADLEKLRIAPPEHARPAAPEDMQEQPRDIYFASIERSHAGLFAKLPYEMMLQILLSGGLSARDVVNLSLTCRHIHSFCTDGYFWKAFFQRCYPNSTLVASTLDDWLAAFAQESNFAGSEMRCFASKVTMDEDVLGLPVDFTVNPKTKQVDYIYLVDSSDLLSRTAFMADGVRRTTWNREFSAWCPMFLSDEHFRRALPDIQEFMVKMSPELGTRIFSPRMVLSVIPKMMNTLVVLLMDEGEKVSTKAVEGYFLLHRLFRAMVSEYPQLQAEIEERIRRVIERDDNRTKSALPNLGNFLPLLSVSEKYSWVTPGLSRAIIGETFDRGVIWAARENRGVLNVNKFPPDAVAAHDAYLKLWLEPSRISRRLLAFHVRLLFQLRQKPGSASSVDEIATANDLLYGRPPRPVVDKFQRTVQKIMSLETWPQFFEAVFVPVPPMVNLTALLQQSVRNSLRKRYHRAGMDFSRIQASGVSRLLLRGQSYSVPPNLAKLEMRESWRWESNYSRVYLDATCTAFDFSHKFVDEVTFGSRIALCGDEENRNSTAALRHSGDEIDDAISRGQHTIQVDLARIAGRSNVKALVFCMSAWQRARLCEFKAPEVTLVDPATKVELATYNFKNTGGEEGKSVVMAVLWRGAVGGKWELKAVGDIGMGDLTRPNTLREEMKESLRKIW
ncbi:Ubiquitin-conjugating enzyme [Drechslerella dactyloides]|uniref:Ubiquitin-conjugating enzyme n=1 Tax=Drechslerella dactyloides TaxID=74499 RepID=A0AAD6J1D8_DREDA|nr:Ubiquitin-conjugating enzyme [Drechslerella dactyloides]